MLIRHVYPAANPADILLFFYRLVLRYLTASSIAKKSGCDNILSSILHDHSTPNPVAIFALKSIFEEGKNNRNALPAVDS